MKICDHNCFNCTHDDCILEESDFLGSELKIQKELDTDISKENELENPNLDYRRRWELNNPERAKANKQRYYAEHKDEITEKSQTYYQNNKAEILEQQKRYYQNNKSQIDARNRENKRKKWAENPEYYRQKQREYRARKKMEKLKEGG